MCCCCCCCCSTGIRRARPPGYGKSFGRRSPSSCSSTRSSSASPSSTRRIFSRIRVLRHIVLWRVVVFVDAQYFSGIYIPRPSARAFHEATILRKKKERRRAARPLVLSPRQDPQRRRSDRDRNREREKDRNLSAKSFSLVPAVLIVCCVVRVEEVRRETHV